MDLITVTRSNGLAFDIRVRGHTLRSDMAPEDGGVDDGPSPAELLGCSLGACVAMMLQDYCERHEHVAGDVAVALTLELAQEPKRVAAITVDVELPNDVAESELPELRRVAEAGVVRATLARPPEVDIELNRAAP